ncbi:MAG: endolytic transglycosylase MltG [Clostridiales bacterium]|nr:endolytic transglycosylase MltG [Clostridiales bacterium]
MEQKEQTVDTKTLVSMVFRFIFSMVSNVIVYLVIIFLAVELCITAYEYAYQIFGDVTVASEPGTDVTLKIESGDSSMAIARRLENNRVIVNQYTFYIRTKLSTSERKPILPGRYTFNTSMTYDEIIQMITDPEYQAKPEGEEQENK